MRCADLFETTTWYWVLIKDGVAKVISEDDFATVRALEAAGWEIIWDSAHSPEQGYARAATRGAKPADAAPPLSGVTQSSAFKAWFGASKVVDAKGQPLKVFHGTLRDVQQFDYIKPNGVGGAGWGFNRIGFWFDAAPATPSTFADGVGGNVMPVYLAIQHPLVLSSRPVSPEALANIRNLRAAYYAADAARNASTNDYDGTAEKNHRAQRAYDTAR